MYFKNLFSPVLSTKGEPLSLAVSDSQIFWTEQNSRSLHLKSTAIASELILGNIGRNLALVGKSEFLNDCAQVLKNLIKTGPWKRRLDCFQLYRYLADLQD